MTSPAYHQWTGALIVQPNGSGLYNPGVIDISNCDDVELNPTGTTLNGTRALWLTYKPLTTDSSVIAASGGQNATGLWMSVYSFDGTTWTLIASSHDTPSNGNFLDFPVTAGTRYYIRCAVDGPGTGYNPVVADAPAGDPATPSYDPPSGGSGPASAPALTLSVTLGVPAASRPGLLAPPISMTIGMRATVVGDIDNVNAPPLSLTVDVPVPAEPDYARPLHLTTSMPSPTIQDAWLILTQPEDGEVVASRRPEFIVALTQHDETVDYTIEIQYADNLAFTGATTITQTVDAISGGLFYTPDVDLPDTVFWRVRLLLDGVEQLGWSAAQTFTIAPAVISTSLPVSWTVTSSADRPVHLWHFYPPDPVEGETVTAYGQGFPLTTGHISVADIPIEIQSWTLIPASPEVPGVIDGEVVDPEHFEVVFTAPLIDNGGGPFVVEA